MADAGIVTTWRTGRLLTLLLPIAAAMFPAPAWAKDGQKPVTTQEALAEPQRWISSEDTILLPLARIGFPTRVAGLTAGATKEFSHQGEGIDTSVSYASADKEVFATAYLYYPGLPHAGLAAIAGDNAIRSNSPSLAGGEARVVSAGGKAGVAIRADYRRFRGELASSAAFIKAGRWIVKLRVSGPEARANEVNAAMTALLDGIRFGKAAEPRAASPLRVSACAPEAGTADARRLPDPAAEGIAARALITAFDGGGMEANTAGGGRADPLPSRVPAELCRTRGIRIGEVTLQVLRASAGAPGAVEGRTMLIVPLSDSGRSLEVVRMADAHVLLHHDIGETSLLSSWDGVPSDRQLAAVVEGADRESLRVRASAVLRPGRADEVRIPAAPPPAATGTAPVT